MTANADREDCHPHGLSDDAVRVLEACASMCPNKSGPYHRNDCERWMSVFGAMLEASVDYDAEDVRLWLDQEGPYRHAPGDKQRRHDRIYDWADMAQTLHHAEHGRQTDFRFTARDVRAWLNGDERCVG